MSETKGRNMKREALELTPGSIVRDAISEAVGKAISKQCEVEFDFNGHKFVVKPTDSLADALTRWEKETGIKPITREQMAKEAGERLETMERAQAEAIKSAGVMTEQQLREAEVPWPKTMVELTDYIKSLCDRPHDYGTCVYAMSMSAVAAFYFASHMVGSSGFQASCADMDIIRRTRSLKGPYRIVDYSNLMYPQYLDDEKVPGWREAINEPNTRKWLRGEAQKKLDNTDAAHGAVRAHWSRLISESDFSEVVAA